jgi:membrane-bound serine protease (ClpP class)
VLGGLTLAFALIVLGFVLLAAELLFPSGVLAVIALIAILVGVAWTFSVDTTIGAITLGVVIVILPLLGILLMRIWPKTWLGRRLFLTPAEEATVAQTSGNQQLEQLVGQYGRTLCELRPSGAASFDGRRVDVITEGMLVDAGQWVRCIDVRAGRVVVRPAEKPDLGKLEATDF